VHVGPSIWPGFEIFIPTSKDNKNNRKNSPPSNDPNHPINVETRRKTKMAEHISMEVVKLLRSGNLQVNLMRAAQSAMSKLKFPIKKLKNKNRMNPELFFLERGVLQVV
jgi:hypothetical protein